MKTKMSRRPLTLKPTIKTKKKLPSKNPRLRKLLHQLQKNKRRKCLNRRLSCNLLDSPIAVNWKMRP
jgi:hypothetical protein